MYTPRIPRQKLLLAPYPRPPNHSPHPRQRRIRECGQLHLVSLLPSPIPQLPFMGRVMLFRALPARALVHNKQAAISRDRNDNDCDRGLDLQPEVHPRGVDEAVRHAAGDAHDGDDHREDAQGEGAAEDELAAEGDADAPEEGDGDGDYCGGVGM